MSFEVLLVVLFAAALHATWNVLIRASGGRFVDTVLIVAGAGCWSALLLVFLPLPDAQSWPLLAASVIIHVAYFTLVAVSYRQGELSFSYPVMRGSAPALSALAAAWLLGESPSLGGWLGVVLISGGVLALAGESRRSGTWQGRTAAAALANAVVIAVYTLVDGQGARLSGHAFAYTAWMLAWTAILLSAIALAVQGKPLLAGFRTAWHKGLLGGACTLAAYGLALWAMTQAPIALVAALRETSVVFATLMAAYFLREPVSRLRYVSIMTVVAGAVAIKLF